MKIPKLAAKRHKAALDLARADRRLTLDEREQIIADFHEGAEHMNGLAGAFFTPAGLANDFSLEVFECKRVLDLCAGIGALSYACEHKAEHFVCVELNPAYVEVGRAVMPNGTWVNASVFDVAAYEKLGPFDFVISNPPFGAIKADGFEGKYTGGHFEYRVIELASRLARFGAFIIPQMSAPFRYSGQPCFRQHEDERAKRFREQTGIVMEPNCGIDTAVYKGAWRGVSPVCEIVTCDFTALEQATSDEPKQLDLLGAA